MREIHMMRKTNKTEEAKRVIQSCIGENGVWAGSKRYQYQCWTRDFTISLPILLDLGYGEISRKHFANIFKRQNSSGEIPVLFADGFWNLFLRKGKDFLRKKKASFVFKRMIWPGLSELSPGTRDVDALCILGFKEYVQTSGDANGWNKYEKNVIKAVAYIEEKLLTEEGLLRGADWRDILEEELKDKTLLSNNAILYQMYKKLGDKEKQEELKNKINRLFWNGEYYKDYPETDDFDPYGQSLAILFNIVPKERYEKIVSQYQKASMPFGFKIKDIFPKPTTDEEKRSVQKVMENTDQFGIVWPYINAFTILALLKVGQKNFALNVFNNWNKLSGFYEWYDPETGKGFGDSEQLWSAALYLRVVQTLNEQ